MGRVRFLLLVFDILFTLGSLVALRSEDDNAMDIDSGSRKEKGTDDLEQYKLDEYDDEAKSSSMIIAH